MALSGIFGKWVTSCLCSAGLAVWLASKVAIPQSTPLLNVSPKGMLFGRVVFFESCCYGAQDGYHHSIMDLF